MLFSKKLKKIYVEYLVLNERRGGELKCYIHTDIHTYPPTRRVLEKFSRISQLETFKLPEVLVLIYFFLCVAQSFAAEFSISNLIKNIYFFIGYPI